MTVKSESSGIISKHFSVKHSGSELQLLLLLHMFIWWPALALEK